LLSSQECVSEQDNKSDIEDARQRQAVRLVKDFIEGAKEVQSMRKPSWDEPRPPAIACNIVWLAISFLFGYLACLAGSPSLQRQPQPSPELAVDTSATLASFPGPPLDMASLVFIPENPVPINHPGSEVSCIYYMHESILTFECPNPNREIE